MNPRSILLAGFAAMLLAACDNGGSSSGGDDSPKVYADRVLDYAPINSTSTDEAHWPFFFHEEVALGAPGGTLDAASLGYDPGDDDSLGGAIVLGFGLEGISHCIVDGTGDDFIVFENPFVTSDDDIQGTNSELALVELSEDSTTWHEFPHDIDEGLPLIDPARYTGFAGVRTRSQGGDRFDLADLIDAHTLPADFQACYIRLTDGGTRYGDYGNTQSDEYRSGADIDAVQALHSAAAPSLADP